MGGAAVPLLLSSGSCPAELGEAAVTMSMDHASLCPLLLNVVSGLQGRAECRRPHVLAACLTPLMLCVSSFTGLGQCANVACRHALILPAHAPADVGLPLAAGFLATPLIPPATVACPWTCQPLVPAHAPATVCHQQPRGAGLSAAAVVPVTLPASRPCRRVASAAPRDWAFAPPLADRTGPACFAVECRQQPHGAG